jgi:hypothetical protein
MSALGPKADFLGKTASSAKRMRQDIDISKVAVGEIVLAAKICRLPSATGTELFCNGSDACNSLC